MEDNVYDLYDSVKSSVSDFMESLSLMHTNFVNEHPTIYVASKDLKQYWFLQVEESTLISDSFNDAYAVSVRGRGVRVYLSSPVSPSQIMDDTTHLTGSNKPSSYGDIANSCFANTLIRYEVFGHISASITPSRISISDVIRNATSADLDDYLIDTIPNPEFVGNFAKYASWLLNGTSMSPTA